MFALGGFVCLLAAHAFMSILLVDLLVGSLVNFLVGLIVGLLVASLVGSLVCLAHLKHLKQRALGGEKLKGAVTDPKVFFANEIRQVGLDVQEVAGKRLLI